MERRNGGWEKTELDAEDAHQKEVREDEEPGGAEDTILSKSRGVRYEEDCPSRGRMAQSLRKDLDFTLKTV